MRRWTREQCVQQGRIGAYVTHSRYNGQDITHKARIARDQRFYREVDPDGELARTDTAELEKRVECAKRAHCLRMAAKSAEVRRTRAEQRKRDRSFHYSRVA